MPFLPGIGRDGGSGPYIAPPGGSPPISGPLPFPLKIRGRPDDPHSASESAQGGKGRLEGLLEPGFASHLVSDPSLLSQASTNSGQM